MEPNERKLITFTRFDQIKPVAREWIIDGILPADSIMGVVGKSGCGKSFTVDGMACSVVTGQPYMGRTVQQGAVFYIGGEGIAAKRKRFAGLGNFNQVSLDNAPLYVSNGLPPLHDSLNVASVIAEITTIAEDLFFNSGGIEPTLVVVDTLARAMGGADENSAADIGRIVEGLDWIRTAWSCCVLVVHHTGHGENTKERARGSSAYYAALDGEILVQSSGQAVTLRSTKEKDWSPFVELSLDRHIVEVDSGGVTETTLVLAQGSPSETAQRARERRHEIRRLRDARQSIRAISEALGITKAKVEWEIQKIREEDQYRQAHDGV